MPKIYEYLGLYFFFYAHEHLPIHVHVSKGGCENKIELFFENGKLINWKIRKIKARKHLGESDLKDAIKFIKKYHNGIVEKWSDFFVKNKKVKCEVIKTKIK
jgi:hypothetical protein